MFWCTKPLAGSEDPRNVTGSNGQACFWFNNGCDISCDECDGQTGQVIHPWYINTGEDFPSWAGTNLKPDPTHQAVHPPRPDDGSHRLSICKHPKRTATVCDPKLRTLNIHAPCHSPTDYYQFAPWRAPGSAPVIDSCGVAGGVLAGQPGASAGGDYQNTSKARRSDRGSQLPPRPSGTVWRAGQVVEVAWTRKAWHGGGYSYRLCKATSELTEACFQVRLPLPRAFPAISRPLFPPPPSRARRRTPCHSPTARPRCGGAASAGGGTSSMRPTSRCALSPVALPLPLHPRPRASTPARPSASRPSASPSPLALALALARWAPRPPAPRGDARRCRAARGTGGPMGRAPSPSATSRPRAPRSTRTPTTRPTTAGTRARTRASARAPAWATCTTSRCSTSCGCPPRSRPASGCSAGAGIARSRRRCGPRAAT